MDDIMKNIKSLEESGLLIKDVSEQNGTKRRFLEMLLDTSGAILLGNLFSGKR